MSEFSGYEKMPTSLKKLGLDDTDFSEIEKLKWAVTEKVHGANFSFIYEDGALKYGKRKDYLIWTDDFFGFQLVINKIEDNILRLFEKLASQINGSKYIIYGELFGGKYPHPDVAIEKNIRSIQTGVYYSPAIEFCAFDIAIETHKEGAKFYLDYETSLYYFQEYDIFHAKPLFIGKLSEAMNFNTRINSTIPRELNLPEMKENLIEGVVIKPYNQKDTKAITTRPIFKLKNPEFDEENRFHQAKKWSYIPNVRSKSEDLSFILDEIRNYITDNRLNSAISKIGALDINNEQRIAQIKSEFSEDVIVDFNENNSYLLEDLSSEEMAWINERIESEINKKLIIMKNKHH